MKRDSRASSAVRFPLLLFASAFVIYGGPLVAAVVEGYRWQVSPTFVAFHVIPGTLLGGIAILQLLVGVTRRNALAAMLAAGLVAFGPGLGPIIGILHFHLGFIGFVLAYHLIPGAAAAAIAATELRTLTPG